MGNKVLGRRSRSFYRGFNERQVDYIKQKFETISADGKLDKNKFMSAYKINTIICDKFISEMDIDQDSQVDQYQFICMVHSLCSLSIEQLGAMFYKILTKKKGNLDEEALFSFTQICLNYNSYISRSDQKKDIKKINKNKFQKYDFNKDKSFSQDEFCKICLKDQDYKLWMFNMGFITKRQMDFQQDVYDLVDSDIGDQIQRYDKENKESVSKLKQGIQHRLDDDQFQLREEQGEQSIKEERPWVKATKNVIIQQQNSQPPNQSMKIDYVFGYRSFDCRNNVKFDSQGKVVYHQAAIGIVLNPNKNTQQFIIQHKDDITCLDVIQDTVVTGQAGTKPSIIMWETKRQSIVDKSKKQQQLAEDSLPKKMIITDQLKDGISCISLSDSKKRLAAICNDFNHRLIVYDLEKVKFKRQNPTTTDRGIIAVGVTTQNIPFDLKFDCSQKKLALATIKQLLFISFEKGNLNSNRGQYGTFTVSAALCLQPLKYKVKGEQKQYMISGMGNGSIYFWENQICVKSLSGHQGSVSAICARKDIPSFISGDKSGNVIIWNQKFAKQKIITVPRTVCPTKMVVALSCSRNKQLLVGTKSSDIYVMKIGDDFGKANKIMSGHNDGYLWGLVVDKDQNYIYTGGEDRRLIKWDYGKKKYQKQILCPYPIRSMDLYDQKKNDKGVEKDVLVVGYKNGVVQCYDPNTLENLKHSFTKIKNPDQEVLNLIKLNKDGTVCLACYQYPKFKILALNLAQKKKGQMQMLDQIQVGSKVIAVDFDNDYRYIRVNTAKFQYLVYELQLDQKRAKFVKITDLSKVSLKRQNWSTHTIPFSPETQGLLTQGVIEQDIVCCQRDRRFRNVFLIGDKYSKIKLFNYPSKKNKIFNKFVGHSNEVTGIQFDKKLQQDKNDKYQFVFSIGGPEKSIIVWKYNGQFQKNQLYLQKIAPPSDDENQQMNQLRKKKKKMLEQGDYKVETAVGEQAMATKAFAGQIKLPSDYKQKYNARKDNQLPQQTISIRHVFGLANKYIADNMRNQVRFTDNFRQVVFPTACLGVKMDIDKRKQKYYHAHREDIVSFAVSRDRKIMATGQMAQKNTAQPKKKIVCIYVWDLDGYKVLNKLDGFHSIAVVLLQFSPNGKLLYSCGNDAKNSFAIYDWISGSILYSGPTSGSKVNGIAWKTNQQFITCGMDHVKFWTGGKGQLGKTQQKFEAMYSCISSKNIYITGSGDGGIYNWIGNKSKSKIKSHTGKVHALAAFKQFIYSGADDGIIMVWRAEANGQVKTPTKFFDTRQAKINFAFKEGQINQQQYGVLSIDFSDKNELLVGTIGASIIYKSGNTVEIIHQGHYKGELWGLTTRVTRDSNTYFITGGDDRTGRLWDIQNRRQISRAYFKQKIRGLDWSPDGSKIVVADCKVRIHLFDGKQLKNRAMEYKGVPFQKNKNQKFPFVQQIKFSPDSSMVAYGSHGQSLNMEILQVKGDKLALKKTFTQGSSALLHIDWARDSSYISLNNQAYQLLFYDTNGKMISASATKDEEWATWTRKIGFQVKGIFQGVDYSDINTVCRDPTKQFMAVGYDDQSIRLFKYPAYIEKQVHRQYFGHSSHVTRVRFTSDYMVSLGGNDRTIIVWDVQRPNEKKPNINEEDDDGLDDLQQDVDLPLKAITRKPKPIKQQQFYEEEDEGDEFMAIKPWVGAIKPPTYKFPKQVENKPASYLTLQYVHGYRAKDCRQNLFYCDNGTIVFHAAACLIYHDIENNTQKILVQHQDDILSIDYHKETNQVITGQIGPKPFVCLFKDGKLVHTFVAPVKKGVMTVAFSPDGKKAACAGMDDDHHVALLDLANKAVLNVVKGTRKVITKIIWNSNNTFASIGVCHYKLWTVSDKNLTGKQSTKKYNLVSAAFDQQTKRIFTGASKGTIIVWTGSDASKQQISLTKMTEDDKEDAVPAGTVDCLLVQKKLLLAGTKDGFLYVIDKNSKKVLNQISMEDAYLQSGVSSQNTGLRSLCILKNKLLVGTFGSQIYQFDIGDLQNKKQSFKDAKNILKCHYSPNNTWTNQVWGLCVQDDLVYTCSDDATVRVWSIAQRKLVSCTSTNVTFDSEGTPGDVAKDKKTNDFDQGSKSRAVAVSPDGKIVVVGAKDGTVRIYDNKNGKLKIKKIFKHAKQWISDIKFGYNLLAIGSHDNAIYVYDYEDGQIKRKYAPLNKHSSYITHLDISRDSCFMQSTCGAYQLLFWDLNTGKQMTGGASALRDQKWATWTCNLGWPVQGIYPKTTDGTFINAVDRSNLSAADTKAQSGYQIPYLLAAGNDNGKVALYNFPCTIKSSQFVEGKGHSSHVTNVRWSKDDKYIISTGGQDQCVMYWKVTKKQGYAKMPKEERGSKSKSK